MVKGLLTMSVDAAKLAEIETLLPTADTPILDRAIEEIIMLRQKVKELENGGAK